MRIRTIKPSFFKNDQLAELDPVARLLFIGLWCLADCKGRLEDRPRRIRAEILPYDADCDVDALLNALHNAGFVQRYCINDAHFIQVNSFNKHQRITGTESETVSVFPEVPDYELETQDATKETIRKQSGNTDETLRTTGREGKGTEGNGMDHCASGDARPAPLPASPPSSDPHPFDSFWSAYPVKKGKGAARRSWDRQKLGPKLPQLIATIARLRRSDDAWQRGYIPHPATWLNASGWDDEATAPPIFSPQKKGPAGFHRETASAIDLPTLCDPNMPEPPVDWRAMLPVLYDAATPEDIADLSKTPWGLVPIEIRNELTRHHQHTNLKSA